MTTTSVSPRLSADQVESYRDQGYLIVRDPILPADKFDGLKKAFEDILAALPAGERPEGMSMLHLLHPHLFEWIFDDSVLDLVEPILGPDIAVFASHFVCKPKGNGRRVPWHEDSAYWKTQLDPMEVCTVWLALDPSRRENGCMQVIPRTHRTGRKGYSDYAPVDATENVFPSEILKSARDDSQAVALELEPNQASLHDARIMHSSAPNLSTMRRCGFTMRYISTRTRFNHETWGQAHAIYLARGKDHAGNQYADPTRAYPEIMENRYKRLNRKTDH